MCVAYLDLSLRVRRASEAGQASLRDRAVPQEVTMLARDWVSCRGYEVQQLWHCKCVAASLLRYLAKLPASLLVAVCRVVARISAFANAELPSAAVNPQRVSATDLEGLARCRGRRQGRVALSSIRFGAAATGNVLRYEGKLVEVTRVLISVHTAAIASAIDMHPWFSLGRVGPGAG